MRYQISDGETAYRVEVQQIDANTYDLQIDDGPVVRVDAQRARSAYSLLLGGRQFEGSVDEGEGGALIVHVGSFTTDLRVVDQRSLLLTGLGSGPVTGRQELRAQMPGKIVKLLARVGDSVQVDQPLVVIEAMKMENELKAPVDGVIREIKVAEGDAVETHALLLVVEPPDAEPAS